MTKEEAAAALNGNEYGSEGSPELFKTMKDDGLVAVFGYSDDNMEFRGAEEDEVGCYNGGSAHFTTKGLLVNRCEDGCPYFEAEKNAAVKVTAMWAKDGFSWTYATTIPHATFIIKEDGDDYCRGIVFALADVQAVSA